MSTNDTERAKMLRGELYRADDPELAEARARACELVQQFNTAPAVDQATRDSLLRELLGTCGPGVFVEPDFRCDYGEQVHLEAGVFINFGCVALDGAPIRIGARTMLGPGVHLYTATHTLDAETRRRGLELAKPITIGSDCWIGGGAIVCPGVTIGNEAVIGAGSVVTRDVPPGMLALGNPCRAIRAIEPGAGTP